MKYGGPLVTSPSLVVPEKNSTLAMTPPTSCTSASSVKAAGRTNTWPLVGLRMVTTLGGVVSTTCTVWLHWAELPQASVACQVRVELNEPPHKLLVVALKMAMVALPQVSLAVGKSKVHGVPSWTVLSPLQLIVGGVVSTTLTVWRQRLKFPQASVACQVRIAVKVLPQWPVVLVTVVKIVMVAVPLMSVAVGASNVQAAAHSTFLLVLVQVITGAVVSVTITVWLQRLKLPHASVACQTRVASKVLPQ